MVSRCGKEIMGRFAWILALAAVVAGCNEYQECSDDAECGAGQVCVRSRSGWVESSFCAPADPSPDTLQPDTALGDTGPDTGGTDTSQPDVDPCSADHCDGTVRGAAGCLEDGTVCRLECTSGYADCDREMQNGCEVVLATDPNHCSVCGRVCDEDPGVVDKHATGRCNGTACVPAECIEGWYDFDDDVSDGCEVGIGEPRRVSAGSNPVETVARTASGTFWTRGSDLKYLDDNKAMLDPVPPPEDFDLTSSGTAAQLRAVEDPDSPGHPWVVAVTTAGRVDIARVASDDRLERIGSAIATAGLTSVDIVGEWASDTTQGPAIAVVEPDSMTLHFNCIGAACGARSTSADGDGTAVPATRIIDFKTVGQLLVSSHGPRISDPAFNEFRQFRPTIDTLVSVEPTGTNNRPGPAIDIEPWLQGEGMALLMQDGTVELWSYLGTPSIITDRVRAQVITDLPAGVTDLVALGPDHFAVSTPEGITLFSVAEGEAERISLSLAELLSDAEPDAHGPISFDVETSTLAVVYGTAVYLVPLTFE